ncbi:MAG TPA: cytochrome b/b6 domain-containing protein [Myxococcaceae bacterium]|nr:cytochrome b/b6 domain-containing protein [Myxococcaceae bacterium]
MPRLVQKHSLATRWFHWVNFPVLGVMVGSGLLIYWANDVYRVGVGGWTLIRFFPDWVYRLLSLDHGLALGMGWHFAFAWLFVLNGLAYVVYIVSSGEWRQLVPRRRHFREAWDVVRHDLGLRKEPLPPAKFNAAQRVTYSAIVVMGALITMTGFAIYRPTQLAWLTALCGGYQAARFEHFWLMMGFVAFFGLHLVQVVRAGWNNFRAMVIGVERVDAPPEAPAASPAPSEVRP